jgi:hypothetical protein
MTTINPNSVSGNKNFKQDDGGWSSMYLPAICAAILMAGVLFFAINWSKKPQTTAKINPPIQEQASAQVPSTPALVAEKPKKALKKPHRPPTAKYVNSDYGVSFNYPVKYNLQSGDKLSALPVTYLKQGSMQLAAVDMPADSYPETDFTAALLNVSVSKDMTSDECMQFNQASKEAGDVKPTIVKVGANEYSVFEQINGEGDNKSDLKYFHLFKNSACYEFALAVDTTEKPEDMAQVDHGKVFQQLEKILTTARIKDLQPIEVQNADRTPSTGLPIADTHSADSKTADASSAETKAADNKADVKSTDKTENAQVLTPEQKPEQK